MPEKNYRTGDRKFKMAGHGDASGLHNPFGPKFDEAVKKAPANKPEGQKDYAEQLRSKIDRTLRS